MSRIIQNNVAVHHAARMIRQSGDTARGAVIMQTMQRRRVSQVVREVVATPATLEDLHRLAEISENAQQQSLEPDQVEATIRESTPFAGLIQLLPKDRAELYMLLTLVVAIIQLVVMLRAPEPTTAMTPDQVERIIERVVDHLDHEAPVDPPPTTSPPHCG